MEPIVIAFLNNQRFFSFKTLLKWLSASKITEDWYFFIIDSRHINKKSCRTCLYLEKLWFSLQAKNTDEDQRYDIYLYNYRSPKIGFPSISFETYFHYFCKTSSVYLCCFGKVPHVSMCFDQKSWQKLGPVCCVIFRRLPLTDVGTT